MCGINYWSGSEVFQRIGVERDKQEPKPQNAQSHQEIPRKPREWGHAHKSRQYNASDGHSGSERVIGFARAHVFSAI